jgi:hypothetical protein
MTQQDYHNQCKLHPVEMCLGVANNNDSNYYFGYFEAFVIVALGAFQVYYVMKMLEKRVLL